MFGKTNWIVYDRDSRRSQRILSILFHTCRIEAIPYQKASDIVSSTSILLVHCEALNEDFNQLALLKLTGKYNVRFYCTDWKDRIPQVAYLPDEVERLIS